MNTESSHRFENRFVLIILKNADIRSRDHRFNHAKCRDTKSKYQWPHILVTRWTEISETATVATKELTTFVETEKRNFLYLVFKTTILSTYLFYMM